MNSLSLSFLALSLSLSFSSYSCMIAHISIGMHACMHIYICEYLHVGKSVCVYDFLSICLFFYMGVRPLVSSSVCTYIWIKVMYASMAHPAHTVYRDIQAQALHKSAWTATPRAFHRGSWSFLHNKHPSMFNVRRTCRLCHNSGQICRA